MPAIPFPAFVADTELGGDTPPYRPSALELEQTERVEAGRAVRRRREASAALTAASHQRALQTVAALARTDGFEAGRQHERTRCRYDHWYWFGLGVAAGMLAFGLLLQLARHAGIAP